MKKLIRAAFVYAMLALAGGVFYREFTKFNGFTGKTALSTVHVHLFVLGMAFFLIAALWDKTGRLSAQKGFGWFFGLYNAGLSVTVAALITRGVIQVLELTPSKGLDASLSGVAGLGHILLGVGLLLFFLTLQCTVRVNKGK